MASSFKLLAIANGSSSYGNGFLVFTFAAPDANGNFGTNWIESYVAQLPANVSSNVVPTVAWDSSNGNVLISYTDNSNALQLATLRSGQIIGQIEKLGGAGTYMPPSVLFYENGPLVAFRWTDDPNHSVFRRGPTWPTDAAWTTADPIRGPQDVQVAADGAPVLCRVGADWIYSVYYNGYTPSKNANWIYFNVIDPLGLSRTRVDNRKVLWGAFYCQPNVGNFTGMPAVVVTGSSLTNRKVHIFAQTADNKLWYMFLTLQSNGLPSILFTVFGGGGHQVAVSSPVTIDSTSGAPISAFTYGGNLYVFYTKSNAPTVFCSWRPIESTNAWAAATMPGVSVVSNDPKKGGVSVLLVPSDF